MPDYGQFVHYRTLHDDKQEAFTSLPNIHTKPSYCKQLEDAIHNGKLHMILGDSRRTFISGTVIDWFKSLCVLFNV